MVVYTHTSLDNSIITIETPYGYEESCLEEIRLRGGDTMLSRNFNRSPMPNEKSEGNNVKLNKLLRNISNKKYSHKCLVGDLNFKDSI